MRLNRSLKLLKKPNLLCQKTLQSYQPNSKEKEQLKSNSQRSHLEMAEKLKCTKLTDLSVNSFYSFHPIT